MSKQDELLTELKEIVLQIRQYLCNTEFAPEPFTKPIDPEKLTVDFPKQILAKVLKHRQEDLDKVREEITRLNKKLNDREEDLIEAKREERERILNLLPQIATRSHFNKTCFDCIERIKEQALKGE